MLFKINDEGTFPNDDFGDMPNSTTAAHEYEQVYEELVRTLEL
jgi:hypothetical protein